MVKAFDLAPHPEGGWFRQTWRSDHEVTLADGRVRAAATLIYFYLAPGECSAWHRVVSDEWWLSHTGTVELELGGDGDQPEPGPTHVLGSAELRQLLVPGGVWQRTLPGVSEALVSCLVSPGFEFEDFELARS